MAYSISSDCKGCGACKKKCPWGAILGERKQKHIIEPTICQECSTCWYTCPRSAVLNPEGQRRINGEKPHVPKASIDSESCLGCQNCLLNCQQEAISFKSGMLAGYCQVDQSQCIGCGSCKACCEGECIELI